MFTKCSTQAKRLWERSAFLAQREIDLEKHLHMLHFLKPIFSAWPARLTQIAAHAETLLTMLRRPGRGGFGSSLFASPSERGALSCTPCIKQSTNSLLAATCPEDEGEGVARRCLQRRFSRSSSASPDPKV